MKNIVAIVEARMSSSRLPGKVLLEALNRPMLYHLVQRLKNVKSINEIVIATTISEADQPLVDFCLKNDIRFYRGSEEDVMDRVLSAAIANNADIIVEITGDCPLIDPDLVQQAISIFLANEVDYLANCHIRSYPDGMDIQIFTVKCLQESSEQTHDKLDREHVTLHIRNNPTKFRQLHIVAPPSLYWPELGLTLDEKDDYKLIKLIFEHFSGCINFSCFQILDFLKKFPHLLELNKSVVRKANS